MRSSILLFPKILSKLAASIVTLIGLSSGILSAQDIDLAVRQDIDNSVPSIGDQITYSLYLVNEGTLQATGVQVQSQLPLGAITNVGTNAATGTAVYNPVNGIITWDVASLAGQDSVLLEVTADVAARGVFFNVSQVMAADQNDIDSNPANNLLQEDDISSTCFSVPIFWYPGDEYTVSIPAPYNSGSGIIWYKNGVAVTAGTEGATVNPDSSLTISGPGDFTFETAVSTCPATGCCAIMIEEGPYGEIGNYVWEDTNEDGIQDSGEPAIAGVTVYLYNGSGTLLDSTFTDSNGLYHFDSLTDGDYQVQFIAPNGRNFTAQDNTTDDLDSDAGINGFTQIVTIDVLDSLGNTRPTVDINRNNYTVDAGIIPVYFDLALRKTLVSAGPFVAGDSVIFNLEVINQGNILATQVSIADYTPAGLTLLEANNWTADGDIARYNNLLSVAVGSSENVEVTFIVGSGFAGDVTNAAEITSAKGPAGVDVTDIDSTPDDTIDNDGPVSNDTVDEDGKNGGDEDDHDIEVFTVLPEPQVFDLALTKRLQTAGPYNPGDVITFEIEVYNQGNLDANFVQVSDYVPSGLTFLNVTNNWAQSGDTLRYIPNISLAAGDSTTITATYQINTDASGTIRNEAEIASTKGPNGEDITDVDSTPDEDRTNDGTSINDEINQDGKNGGDEDDHDFESFVVETQNFVFDLALSKSIVISGPYYVGQTITYGLTVSNQGNQNATQINLVDYTPAGLTLTDANWTENGITGNAELNSPLTLSAGNDTLIYITYTVTGSGLIENAAEIASAKGPIGEDVTDIDSTPDTSNTDPDAEDDHDSDTITAQPAPVFDLALTKNVISSAPFEPGDNITYAIQVINEGNIDAIGIEITDYIPAGLTLSDINWAETSPGKLTYNSLLSLAAGNSTTVNITFSIDGSAIGSIVNSAEISAALDSNGDPVTDIDSTPDNINSDAPSEDDHDSEVITITPQATFDLALRKTLGTPAPYQSGQVVTYDIDVINQGDVLATFVNLVDYVPAGLTLVANNNWSMAGANTATYNNQISLAAGTQTTVQISFTIDAGFEGQTIRNIAEISSAKGPGGSDQTDIDSTPDSDSSNDGASTNDEINQDGKNGGDEDDHDYEDITVEAPQNFDLAINKAIETAGPFYPGDSITFSINVFNNGNVLANGVEITDRFPAGLTLADGNWNMNGASAATYTALLSLAPGTSQEINITFAIDPNTASGSYSNVAEITDDKGPNGEEVTDVDSTPDNNIPSEDDQDSAVFTISEQASLGNFVWEDLDQDGIQDTGEPGINGVLVTLERPNGAFVASTTTDANGFYAFDNLATGDYVVVFGQPSGYTATNDNQGGDDALDSDADPITGASHIVNLSAGEYDQTIDAGFYLDSQCYEITAITALNTNICVGDYASFSATSSNDASIAWYYSSSGGAPFGTSASGVEFEVNPTTTTTYYGELTSVGTPGCPNVRVPVTVVVNAIPGTPTCSTPVEVCSGETINLNDHILNPVSIPGSTFEWHTANDPSSPLVSNPTAVGAGLYYLFEKSAAGCFSNAAITTIIEKPCEEFIDLSLIKIADNRNVEPDDLVTYTISVSNAGPDVATNVVIEDILPSGLSFVSSTNFTNNNGTLTSSFASIGVNQTRTLTYVARVMATSGSIVNVAQVKSADQTDVDSTPGNSATNNEDDDDDEIINVIGPDPVSDLRLQKLVSNNTPATGDLISYTIRVTNDGPDDATNVEVQDVIPAGLTFISSTNSSFASGTVTAQFASIPSGETVQFTISATVTGSGTIVNYAQVTASDQDDTDSTPNNGTGANEDDDDSVSITVTDDCNPSTPVISTNNAYICLGESTVLNAIGCNGTVHWSNGTTGTSITVSPESNTTYTATCLVNTCESAPSNQLVIVVNSLPIPTISASKTTICSGESVTLSASNCSGSITWNTGQSTASITVSPAMTTSYSVICTSTVGCSATATQAITVGTGQTPTIVASVDTICNGESSTLTVSNCSGGISWSTGETTPSITVSPTNSTTYTVLCGSGSCSGSASQTVSVGSGTTPNITASDNNICSGETVTLSVDNCNQNIVWSTGQSGSSITVTPTVTTNYTVSCGNICVSTSNVTINVTDGIAPTISASATDICEPADVTLTASGCTGTVAWSNGMTGTSITVNVSQTTTFTATCSSGGSCVSGNSNTVTVNVGTLSTPTITASGSTVCSGSTVTITASSCSGTVVWSNGMTGASITVSPTTKTVYTAICQVGGCSSGNSSPVEVDVITSPNAPVISCSASRICPGDSLVLNGLGCEGTVKWSTGETGSSITVAPTATTIYTATCMIGSCESEISAPATINVGNPFPPQVSCDNTLICLGASTTLEAAGCVGTVVWSDGQTGSVITVSPITMTSYSAICKGSTCESETSNVVTIGVSANSIQAPTVSTLTNTCPVETVNLANGVTSSPVSGGTFVFRTGNSPNSPAVTNASAIASSGTFYVFEKGNNGCYSPGAQIDVAIIACENPLDCSLDPATANAGSDSTICLSSDFYTLNGSIGGAAQAGTWTTSGSGTFENSTSPQTRYFYSLDDVTNGSVVLTLTTNDPDGSGSCEAATSSVTLTINGVTIKPTISSDKSPNICLGDSVILTANETATEYLWSTGDTTKSITVKTPGEYTVRVFNSEGCASLSSDVFTVTTSSTITSPSISDMVSNTCPATSVDLEAAINSTPETNGGEFVFHTGMTPSSPMLSNVSAMPAGTYYLFEKSTTGCYSNPSQVTVVINSCETNEEDAEVGIVIVGNASEVTIGDEVVYTITVTNNGPNVATNVAIENEIPLGIEIVGNTPGLTLSNNYLIATIPSMAVNATETFVYTGKITKSGVISNIAKIIAVDQTDPIKINNISRFDVECSTCLEICIATALDAVEEQQENGSYNVTFTSLVENCGNAELSGVSLTLDMLTMFGTTATYTMIQQPTVNSGSALVANSSFNGNSDQNILINTGSSLQPSDIDTVTWVINVVPNGDKGPFDGNSYVTGVAETIFGTTSEVSDVSNDGLIVDRTDATPTSVRLFKTPSIGIALAIIDTVRQADESLNVTYQAIVKNNGALDLYDVIVKDALSETYVSPITYSMVGVPTANAGSTLQINTNYDGDTDDALTLTGSTLAIGVADTIWFTVNVQPNDKTEFSNQATAQGTGALEDSSTESVVDVSNTGYNPDTPGSQPTILEINIENTQSVQTPCIGSALYAAEVTTQENGSVDVTYKAIIRNCGNVNLSNVRLCDSLTADFGAPVAVLLKSAPSVNSGSTLTIDSNYDGINNVCILDSTNSTLAPGKTDTISWTINLTLNSNNGPFRKNVTVMATSAGGSEVSDISNDGVNPDPVGEAPTVLNFNNLPDDIIGIAKELVSIENVEGNKFDVVFNFTLKNYGKIDFTGVQIQDNLALTFGDKVAIDSVRVFDASEGLTVNENFTGKGLLIDLLVDSTSTLAVNTTKMVSLFTRVDLTEADTSKYENMALAIGYHNGTSTDDQSTTGTNPDPDSDGTPFNNTIPTLIDFGTVVEPENTTPLGIAKAVTDTVSIVDGSYQVTYTVIVKNYGSNALTNIQLTDSLSHVFDDSTDFVLIVPPTVVDANASLKVNAAFDGITDLNMLVADSSSLAAGESDTLTFKVKVRNNSSQAITYNNTVYGSASDGSEIVTDKSNAGLNPDSDADNNPGNNNVPTPLTLKTGENTSNPNVAVLIPGGISPNGDGLNDNLVIEGITADDDVRFKIFNRWGELVFITENYKLLYPGANDGWNGTANTGIRVEKEDSKLPDGTYFYTAESTNVELFDGKPYYNFITISGGTRK
ncbi:SdrD B-like domain-containing protein [Jiulongibacter sediminis]|uniref:SdrD B-like domain-containing protein n=1 Tax=Jiulongibacter sediminis TaxID=1605367 RepID=UPI0013F1671B|nr:SdrD B-like domain-containing protein [Jiulongibacter sediminis]